MKAKLFLTLLLCLIPTLALSQGFDENYEVRKGDLNGDGLTDLYIRQKPQIVILHGDIATPIVLPAPVKEFVLQNQGNGSFSLVTSLSDSQRQLLRNWPGAGGVGLHIADFNLDGSFDLNLRRVGTAISGGQDQIVFSSIDTLAPNSALSLSPALKKYFHEVYEWILDEDYFEITTIENGWYHYDGEEATGWWYISYINFYYSYGGGKRFLDENDDPEDINNKPAYCEDFPANCAFNSTVGAWWVYGTFIENIEVVFEYEHFNQQARQTTELLAPIFENGEHQASAANVAQIANILVSILNVDISLPLPGEVVNTPTAVPIPDDGVKPKLPRIPKLGILGRLLYILDAAEWANERIAENRMVFHYTTAAGHVAISTSGEIINPNNPSGGKVWFTYLAYPNSDVAMDFLALCGERRAGFFVLKQQNVPSLSLFTPVKSVTCPADDPLIPNGGRTGGGWEATAPSPVSAVPIRFVPIPPSF